MVLKFLMLIRKLLIGISCLTSLNLCMVSIIIWLNHFSIFVTWISFSGFVYAVDTLKSVILSLACVDRFLDVKKAVLLSRLEEEYQLGHWGRVEWAHDLSQQDLQARLAAVVLFIHCNNQMSKIQSKQMWNKKDEY